MKIPTLLSFCWKTELAIKIKITWNIFLRVIHLDYEKLLMFAAPHPTHCNHYIIQQLGTIKYPVIKTVYFQIIKASTVQKLCTF